MIAALVVLFILALFTAGFVVAMRDIDELRHQIELEQRLECNEIGAGRASSHRKTATTSAGAEVPHPRTPMKAGHPRPAGKLHAVKGFVLFLVVEAAQAEHEHASVVRVCHDFDAATVADLETAITHASISAKRQLRNTRTGLARERNARGRRDAMRAL